MTKKLITIFMLLPIFLSSCGVNDSLENGNLVLQSESTSVVEVIDEPNKEVINYERVEFISADGTVLVGRVDLPDGDGPFPAFVYVDGSGRSTKERAGLGDGDALVEAGYALLRYDKRGVGESGGTYAGVGPSNGELILGQLAQDASAGADFLAQLEIIESNNIGLFGNSQAGWIIPSAANSSDSVAYAAIMVGPAVSVGMENFYSRLTGGDSVSEEELAMFSERLATFSLERDYDPRDSIEALEIPVLWVLGRRDPSIPTIETVAILDEIITEFEKDFTIHVFPFGNHNMTNADTGERLDFIGAVVLPWIEVQKYRAP